MYDIEVKKYLLFCVLGNTLIYKTASPVLVLNTNIIRDFSNIRTNVVVRLPISSCKYKVRYIDIVYICKQEKIVNLVHDLLHEYHHRFH
jgi:hypothetical protein